MSPESIIDELKKQSYSESELLIGIHNYVRDNIKFGFTVDFENVTPEKTLQHKMGHCNAQADLFRYLLKCAEFESRLSFVFINKSILKNAIPTVIYLLLPEKLFHAVTQIKVSEEWLSTDSYIFTKDQFYTQKNKLIESSMSEGFGIHQNSVCEWDGEADAFSQANESLSLHQIVFCDLALSLIHI